MVTGTTCTELKHGAALHGTTLATKKGTVLHMVSLFQRVYDAKWWHKYDTFVMMWKLHLIIISSKDHESESVILHYSLEIWKQCPFKSPDNKSDSSKVHQVHHEGHAALTIRSEDDSRFPWLWIRIGVDSWTFLIGTSVTTPRLSFCLVQQTRPSPPRPAPRAPLASASPRVRGPNLRSSVTTPTLN